MTPPRGVPKLPRAMGRSTPWGAKTRPTPSDSRHEDPLPHVANYVATSPNSLGPPRTVKPPFGLLSPLTRTSAAPPGLTRTPSDLRAASSQAEGSYAQLLRNEFDSLHPLLTQATVTQAFALRGFCLYSRRICPMLAKCCHGFRSRLLLGRSQAWRGVLKLPRAIGRSTPSAVPAGGASSGSR